MLVNALHYICVAYLLLAVVFTAAEVTPSNLEMVVDSCAKTAHLNGDHSPYNESRIDAFVVGSCDLDRIYTSVEIAKMSTVNVLSNLEGIPVNNNNGVLCFKGNVNEYNIAVQKFVPCPKSQALGIQIVPCESNISPKVSTSQSPPMGPRALNDGDRLILLRIHMFLIVGLLWCLVTCYFPGPTAACAAVFTSLMQRLTRMFNNQQSPRPESAPPVPQATAQPASQPGPQSQPQPQRCVPQAPARSPCRCPWCPMHCENSFTLMRPGVLQSVPAMITPSAAVNNRPTQQRNDADTIRSMVDAAKAKMRKIQQRAGEATVVGAGSSSVQLEGSGETSRWLQRARERNGRVWESGVQAAVNPLRQHDANTVPTEFNGSTTAAAAGDDHTTSTAALTAPARSDDAIPAATASEAGNVAVSEDEPWVHCDRDEILGVAGVEENDA